MRLFKVLTIVCCSIVLGATAAHARPMAAFVEEETSISEGSEVSNALCSANPDVNDVTGALLNTGAFDQQYNPTWAALSVGQQLTDEATEAPQTCSSLDDKETPCYTCSCYTRCCYRSGRLVAC